MGSNCSTCNCSKADEVTVVQLGSDSDVKLKLRAIVRVQAWFRGHRARKMLATDNEYLTMRMKYR